MFVLEYPGRLTMEAMEMVKRDFMRAIEEDGLVLLTDGMTCKHYTVGESEELEVREYLPEKAKRDGPSPS